MSTPGEPPANPQVPETIEGPGRYAVYQTPDGGWVIARATGLCETCLHCGCGEQADQIQVPAMVIALARQQGPGRRMGLLKGARRGG